MKKNNFKICIIIKENLIKTNWYDSIRPKNNYIKPFEAIHVSLKFFRICTPINSILMKQVYGNCRQDKTSRRQSRPLGRSHKRMNVYSRHSFLAIFHAAWRAAKYKKKNLLRVASTANAIHTQQVSRVALLYRLGYCSYMLLSLLPRNADKNKKIELCSRASWIDIHLDDGLLLYERKGLLSMWVEMAVDYFYVTTYFLQIKTNWKIISKIAH